MAREEKKQNLTIQTKAAKKVTKIQQKASEKFSKGKYVIFKYEEEYFPRIIISIEKDKVTIVYRLYTISQFKIKFRVVFQKIKIESMEISGIGSWK